MKTEVEVNIKHQCIAVVKINNPPMNVLNSQIIKDLEDIFISLEENEEVKVVILTSEGSKAFMAGADIKEFPEIVGTNKGKTLAFNTHKMHSHIEDLSKPTIALLNGLALGGGCELALTCDILIAEEHAKIGLPEVNLGIIPGGGGTQKLTRLIGKHKAKEIMFTGEYISAHEAKSIGLINKVIPSEKGMEQSLELAQKIAEKSLDSLTNIKIAINKGENMGLKDSLSLESELFGDIFLSKNAKEGINAFLEKREPDFL